jgi:crossover junction endonuclease MUS81
MNSASNSKLHPITNKSRNPFNQFLVEKFINLKRIADSRGFKNQAFCYGKILRSLIKYPIPILTLKQMTEIEGIGEKTSYSILKMIKKQYAKFVDDKNNKINDEINDTEEKTEKIFDNLSENDFASEDETTDKPFGSTANKRNILINSRIKSSLKRPESVQKNEFDRYDKRLKTFESEELLEKQSNSKPTSKYKIPEVESNPWAILIGLFCFQQNQQKKYATKKEIKIEFEKLSFKCEINNWNSLRTFVKNELIYKYPS